MFVCFKLLLGWLKLKYVKIKIVWFYLLLVFMIVINVIEIFCCVVFNREKSDF